MQVEYDLGPDDFVALNIHLNNRRSTGRWLTFARWAIFAVQLVLLVVVFYPQLASGGTGIWMGLLPIVGVAGLWLVVVPFVFRQWIRSQVTAVMTSERAKLGRHWLTLSAVGIADRSEHGEATTSWHEVEELASTRAHLFLYTSPTSAHVVPRRAFGSSDEFDTFVAEATQLREASRRHRPARDLARGKS